MANFILPTDTLSVPQAKAALMNWISELPRYAEYKNFYQDEATNIILTLISALDVSYNYQVGSATLNNYLNYVNNRASAVAISSNLAYNVFRGQNKHFTLRVLPTFSTLLPKFERCGSVAGVSISPITDYVVIQGQPITIEFVIGDIVEEEIIIPDDRLNIFVFALDKVTQDFKLLLNDNLVQTTAYVTDLLEDKWFCLTNSFGGLDIYYLNKNMPGGNPLTPYTTGDILKLSYVKSQNVSFTFPDEVLLDFGTVVEGNIENEILFNFRSQETKESIQVNAPLSFEVQRTIRGREDYSKYFKILNSMFADTSSRPVYLPVIYLDRVRAIPAFTDVSYVNSDDSLMLPGEKTAVLNNLNKDYSLPHGIPSAEIVDPKKIIVPLEIILSLKTGENVSNYFQTYLQEIEDIMLKETDNRGISKNRSRKLGYTLNLKNIEYDFERLSYILIARVNFKTLTWTDDTEYKRGDLILPTVSNGYMYEVISETYDIDREIVALNSGSTEPVWVEEESSLTLNSYGVWQPSTSYNIGDLVLSSTNANSIFRCKTSGTSDTAEPVWNYIVNCLIPDNDITWQAVNPYEVNNELIYKAMPVDSKAISCDWNEYYLLNGDDITWD